jgi:hypothetical protein
MSRINKKCGASGLAFSNFRRISSSRLSAANGCPVQDAIIIAAKKEAGRNIWIHLSYRNRTKSILILNGVSLTQADKKVKVQMGVTNVVKTLAN